MVPTVAAYERNLDSTNEGNHRVGVAKCASPNLSTYVIGKTDFLWHATSQY